ncbi:ABC transporter permease [Thermanaerothrix sp.]|jgi:ABC-type nitrate/sulfonate/bicarbonate transport system permease component|uniref:ABC transporter permease n=1 Tax=Thermanaerothrix sp. TaxID=2972675 RepID=UPI002ADD84FB|nr:ABC transporter permease [Thermanaerothrix sp.]
MTGSTRSKLITWGLIVGALSAWEVGVRVGNVPPYLLPAPSLILRTLIQNLSTYLQASLITFGEALLGLLIGTCVGVLIAILVTFWPGLEHGVMSLAILVKSTPLVAIAPLLTIWLGFGWQPKVIITALVTFFPVLVNVLVGLQTITPSLLDLFHAWQANRWELLWHLRLPHSLPYVFAALKVSTPLALIGAIVAEWTGASGGLGRLMWLAYTNLNLPHLFAAIFILATAGMLLYQVTTQAEKRLVFWYTSS